MPLSSYPRGMGKKVKRTPEMWLVAYFLVRCGAREQGGKPKPPTQLDCSQWGLAYAMFYERLGGGRTLEQFKRSLRNARDYFDSHLDSGRMGWRSGDPARPPAPLPGDGQKILAYWEGRSDDELWKAVSAFVD